MKEIKLTRGKSTVIDDIDDDLCGFSWYAKYSDGNWYACHTDNLSGKTIRLHKVIAVRMGMIGLIDHRDRDGLNNTRENLRQATTQQNTQNKASHRNSLSRYKGVSRDGNKWRARIIARGSNVFLGNFDNEADAAVAYDKCAVHAHGEFAVLNFPEMHGKEAY